MSHDVPKCRSSPASALRSEGGPRRPGVRGVAPRAAPAAGGASAGPEVPPAPRPPDPSGRARPLFGVYPGWGRAVPGSGEDVALGRPRSRSPSPLRGPSHIRSQPAPARPVRPRLLAADLPTLPRAARRGHLDHRRRTVSNLLRTLPGLAPGDPSSYHRVFSKRRWSSLRLARLLAKFILDHFVADGPVFLAGDDTVDEHRGAKVHGKGCHRDPVRSTHSFTAYRWGHKWVVLTILVQFPFAVRPWALPVLVALYRGAEKDMAKSKAKKVKDKGQDQGQAACPPQGPAPTATRRHKTPSELMRQLLAVLIHWFPDRQFVFAGDGGYGTHALARFAHRHQRHLSPGQPLLPRRQPVRPAPGGRRQAERSAPQEGGQAALAPGGGGDDLGADGPGCRLVWGRPPRCRGRHRDGPVVQERQGPGPGPLGLRPGSDRDASRLVSVQHRPGPDGSTGDRDVHRSLVDRDHVPRTAGVLGPGDDPRLEGADGLACGAVPVRPVLGGGLALRRLPSGTDHPGAVTYRGKTEVAFSDAITAVRRRLWLEGVFQSHGQAEVFQNLPRPFQAVLLAALAPAA